MTSGHGNSPSSAIAAEIKLLRKGRGIRARDLDQRCGPYLRELAGSRAGEVAELRRVLAVELTAQAAKLPEDLRTAAMVSLGLSEDTKQLVLFGDRVAWLAEQSSRNDRTILRRIDVAEQLLAEEIAGELQCRVGTLPTANGWYLDEFRTVLRLDTPTPEAHERRRIVATRAGLSQVTAWVDVPRDRDDPPSGLDAQVLCGGRLVRRAVPATNLFEFVIELPAPLDAGEQHEYELILRMPPGEQMRPHYIYTPEYKCNAFDLTVRFDLNHQPAWTRMVSGETVRKFENAVPNGKQLSLNGAGEVHVRFGNPVMYLGYGVQWQFS
jgi:hypothetical protein